MTLEIQLLESIRDDLLQIFIAGGIGCLICYYRSLTSPSKNNYRDDSKRN